MAIGLLGKKLGMTRIYDDYGRQLVVTAVEAGPCKIVGLRRRDPDGYTAVQVGFEPVQEPRLNKPQQGQFKKAGQGSFRYVREFRVAEEALSGKAGGKGSPEEKAKSAEKGKKEEAVKPGEKQPAGYAVGQEVTVSLFQKYEFVDVVGTSRGMGFQGGMKRWGWSGGPESHGSMSHRAPGSIGASAFPGHVVKGHHLPGHMGAARVTMQNVRIVGVDPEANLLLLEGGLPGPEESLLIIRKSLKRFEIIKKPQAIVEVEEEEEAKGKKGAKPAAKAAKKK